MLSLEKQTTLKVIGLKIQVLLTWIMISVAVSSISLLIPIFLFLTKNPQLLKIIGQEESIIRLHTFHFVRSMPNNHNVSWRGREMKVHY